MIKKNFKFKFSTTEFTKICHFETTKQKIAPPLPSALRPPTLNTTVYIDMQVQYLRITFFTCVSELTSCFTVYMECIRAISWRSFGPSTVDRRAWRYL